MDARPRRSSGRLFNSGQYCTAATRIIVMGDGYEPCLEKFIPEVESIKAGDPASD